MKNLLLILPLSLVMAGAMAQGDQNSKMNTSTASLDGKAFKITMSQRMDHSGATGTSSEGMTTGSTTTADPGSNTTANTTTNSSGTSATTTTQSKSGSGMESMSNKKMIIHFNNGTIRSNALTMQGITSCPYNVTSNSGTMTTFNANCSGASTGKSSGSVDSKYNQGTGASTKPDQNNTSMSSGTANTTPADKTAADAGDQNSVNSGTPAQTGTTANTNTGVSSGTVKAMWSGTVDGTTVRGNFTWTNESGQTYYYTFTGTKASQKELDNEQELGSR